MTPLDPYDKVAYATIAQEDMHPDHLATLATLHGMRPAHPERCRVLEIGCGDGANLLPLAVALPQSEFLGIDLAEQPIARGQQEIAALGLTNLQLEQRDLTAFDPGSQPFDYVLVQGVYSWVAEPVRDALLGLCRASLAPHGVAFVSYNTLPGGYGRNLIGDLLRFRVSGIADPVEKVKVARGLLRQIAEDTTFDDPYRTFQRELARLMMARSDSGLLHDDLAPHYEPTAFRDFMAHAGRHGLQYLAEANFVEMQEGVLPPAHREVVDTLPPGDLIGREQMADYLKCRKFRQTLLCRTDVPLDRAQPASRVTALRAACPLVRDLSAADALSPETLTLESEHGASIKTAHPLAKWTLRELGRAWPRSLPFTALRASADAAVPASGTDSGAALAGFLYRLYAVKLVELHVGEDRFSADPSDRPLASPLARRQMEQGSPTVVDLRNRLVGCDDELARRLLPLLDGTRTRDQLSTAGTPEQVDEMLRRLGKLALLMR